MHRREVSVLRAMDIPCLEELVDAARLPLESWRERYPGHRAMGVTCSYVPEEILHAAGFTPVRLRGVNAPPKQAEAHLQAFSCALCRSMLDQVLTGRLGFLEGIVFAHTCDTMQALADLSGIQAADAHFVDTVMLPTNLGSRASRAYLVAELGRFRRRLEAFWSRPIEDGEIRSSIGLYNETRRLVQALAKRRDCLSASHFFGVLDAAQTMPRSLFNPLLRGLLSDLDTAPSLFHRPRLFLTGAVLDEPIVVHLIRELGATVAGDDLCSGSRHFFGQVVVAGDPIASLADYSLLRPPCPSKLKPGHDAAGHLLEQVRQAQADGVVFVLEKYCDPHAFESALVRRALQLAGVPCLLLEVDLASSLEGLRTRLGAFVEMLS